MSILTYSEFNQFKIQINQWLNDQFNDLNMNLNLKIVFISYGNLSQRCKVWNTSDEDTEKVIKRTLNFLDKLYDKDKKSTEILKVDIAYNIEKKSWVDVVSEVKEQNHNNHYRKGISFVSDFGISFMEQEIYGSAIIKGISFDQPNFFDEKNLNDAIKKKYPSISKKYNFNEIENVWTFDTKAVFFENGKLIPLNSTGYANGVRIAQKNLKDEVKEIIIKNAEFLHQQILDDGKFVYGYFPAYNNEIKSYNTIRHCTAIYSLLESLEIDYQEKYLTKIQKSIQYAIQNFYKDINNEKAFMIDFTQDQEEIKLGSNAAAIFMFAKYQEVTKDNQYKNYAEKLAIGIQSMIDNYGETTHILHYPSLIVKEKFRIVYYDGEAALGLLRLYQINNDQKLIDTVKLMFENFVNKQYDKYHDHWLSYCTNELTIYCPEEKYFKFGLDNYLKHMEFIRNRKTAYATFLEMMMSAYKMVNRIEEQKISELFEQSKFEQLKDLINFRVEFQRVTGFFYPEVAMYMAKPKNILNAFYIRHDRFRTRIDDQEHNLSGYIAYYNHFKEIL